MATLPNQQVKVLDETRGIQGTPAPASIKIASFIKAPTGPLDITELSSKQQLINLFLAGSSIAATDDITIQYNAALLDSTKVHVVRIDTSNMRVGLGATGTKMYFDTSYNLINKVTLANIKEKEEELTSLWIVLDKGENKKTLYYLGTGPNEITADVEVNLDEESDEVTIAKFFDRLNSNGVLYDYSDTEAKFIYPIVKITEDLNNPSTDDYKGMINTITATQDAIVENTGYMMVNNYAFYNGNFYANAQDLFSNPISIDYINDKTSMPSEVFLLKVMEYIYTSDLIKDPWGQSVKVNLSITDATITTNELSDYLEIDSLDSSSVRVVNGNKVLSSGDLKIEVNGEEYEYSFGDSTVGTNIAGKSTVQGFLELVHEQLVLAGVDSDLTITNADDTGGPVFLYNNASAPNITINGTKSTYEVKVDNDYVVFTHATDADNSLYNKVKSQWILIDNTCYYGGESKPTDVEGATTYVKVTNLDVTTTEFLTLAYQSINNSFILSQDNEYGVVLSGDHEISASDNISVTNKLVIDQTKYDDDFAIVLKFPCSQALFKIEYKYNEDEYNTIDVTYSYKGDITSSFTMSFDGLAMNGFGASLYYEKYNDDPTYSNPYIHITKLNGSGHFSQYTSPDFGNELKVLEPTEAQWAAACDKFMRDKSNQYDFITDAGHCSVPFYTAIKAVADKRYIQYPPSFPVEYKTVTEILSYYESIDANDCEIQMLVPAHKNAYNGSFMSLLPASFVYILTRLSAFNTTVNENAPLFGPENGAVTAPNLVKIFDDDEEAQALADKNINVITKDENGTYIRSNFTGQVVNSYMSEDQNVYMSNLIAHICEKYNPSIQSKLNTKGTRDQVITDITNNITDRLVKGKNPTLAKFKVVCDEELNTQAVIEARQLVYQVWVQYTPSVAYVLAYVKVVRLNSF